jgi:hypothetical protein
MNGFKRETNEYKFRRQAWDVKHGFDARIGAKATAKCFSLSVNQFIING